MKTVKAEVINEIIINKSRFITILSFVSSKEEVNTFLEKYKKIYKDATHYCFAYILESTEKYNDDGEPAGTAGMPILNVLQKHNLTNIICLVIRYFGGIKLGAGGLVRAYSNSASLAIKEAKITDIINGFNVTITFPYDKQKTIDNLKLDIKDKSFTDKITYNFNISKEDYLNKKDIIDKYLTYKIEIKILKTD